MTVLENVWEVVGGCGADGIVVRVAKDRTSPQAQARLAHGAVVRALEHDPEAGRLRYELVEGVGPSSGWVSTCFRGKDLLVAKEKGRLQEPSPALKWYSQQMQHSRLVAEDQLAPHLATRSRMPHVVSAGSTRDAVTQQQQRGVVPHLDVLMDMESLMKNALAVAETERACVGFGAIAGQQCRASSMSGSSWQRVAAAEAARKEPSNSAQVPGIVCSELVEHLAPHARFNERLGHRRNLLDSVCDEDASAVCPHCQLPVGDWGYSNESDEASLIHGECMAKQLLEKLAKEDAQRKTQEAVLKQSRREEFGIGWKAESLPSSTLLAERLQSTPSPQGAYGLVLEPATRSVRIRPSLDPATIVNLEYLATMLEVRRRDGREPLFSLDPKLSKDEFNCITAQDMVQVQHFEPQWLSGTKAGEVMFQADYHLKELSMGEEVQPVVGMRSCMDLAEERDHGSCWRAREWFVVKKANVSIAYGNTLHPHVEMGVEAREVVEGQHGLEDAHLTSPDHPLVQYAEAFTHNFELIAERRSSIYHLRELAKAAVLAKLLLDDETLTLEDGWFESFAEKVPQDEREIPQLWNESSHCKIRVKDGKLLDVEDGVSTRRHGVYGGVQFGVEDLVGEFAAAPLFSAVTALSEEPGQYTSFADITGGAVVAPVQPRGVDLSLDRFNLVTPEVTGQEAVPPPAVGGFGKDFWTSLESRRDSIFSAEDAHLLKVLFNPNMSDRRLEGDHFIPPDASPGHFQKVCNLLMEEEAMKQQRKAIFCSDEFQVENIGPCFPSSWASNFGLAYDRPILPGSIQEVRVPDAVEAAKLQSSLQRIMPSFDHSTEDGTRYRIFQVGRLEVRTIQEPEGQEVIGAVCSRVLAAGPSKPSDAIVKASEYVEVDNSADAAHFYVVLETESGNFIVTEKLTDGKIRWAMNPKHLEMRNSLARVTGCAECRVGNITVRDVQHSEVRALLSNCGRRQYARGVFGLAQPACRKSWAALTPVERQVAEGLGAGSREGWDESLADVWGKQWWQLSDSERAAAAVLGAGNESWDDVRRSPKADT